MNVEWFIIELADTTNIMSLVTSVSMHQIMKDITYLMQLCWSTIDHLFAFSYLCYVE